MIDVILSRAHADTHSAQKPLVSLSLVRFFFFSFLLAQYYLTMVATWRNFELARDELVVQLSVDCGTGKKEKRGMKFKNKKDNDEEKWFFPFSSQRHTKCACVCVYVGIWVTGRFVRSFRLIGRGERWSELSWSNPLTFIIQPKQRYKFPWTKKRKKTKMIE
jgi:hypothetical protein